MDFLVSFQNEPCLAPYLILSDYLMRICPHQGIRVVFHHPTFSDGFMRSSGYEV